MKQTGGPLKEISKIDKPLFELSTKRRKTIQISKTRMKGVINKMLR